MYVRKQNINNFHPHNEKLTVTKIIFHFVYDNYKIFWFVSHLPSEVHPKGDQCILQ